MVFRDYVSLTSIRRFVLIYQNASQFLHVVRWHLLLS